MFHLIKHGLQRRGMRQVDKVPRLIEALSSKHECTRDRAARQLARIGDVRAVVPLVECYIDPKCAPAPDIDGEVSWAIPNAIRTFGEQAVAALLPHLHVHSVIWTLGRTRHESAVEPLIAVFEDETFADKRFAILHALGCIGSDRALPFLQGVLKTYRHPEEANWARTAIGRVEGTIDRGHCY